MIDQRLKYDGSMRTFGSGATRDSNADKIEYRRHFSSLAVRRYGEYMHKHRLQSDGKLREPDNWKKGIPLTVYYDSLDRHDRDLMYNVELNGNNDEKEELLCAIIFNAMGALHELVQARNNEQTDSIPSGKLDKQGTSEDNPYPTTRRVGFGG